MAKSVVGMHNGTHLLSTHFRVEQHFSVSLSDPSTQALVSGWQVTKCVVVEVKEVDIEVVEVEVEDVVSWVIDGEVGIEEVIEEVDIVVNVDGGDIDV